MQSRNLPRNKRLLDPQDGNGSNNNNRSKLAKRGGVSNRKTVLSLPLKIWLSILKHLPLRHVLTLASVSREFYEHVFNMPEFWIFVQTKAKCNNHVPSSDAPLAFRGLECRQLIINYINVVCDYCYGGAIYSVEYDGYKAVLPVRISQKDANTIRRRRYSVYLCGTCRILHYQAHPEPIYADTRATILSREEISTNYCIQKKDVAYLISNKEGDIDRRSDAYVRLFARCIYGGDVGIEAEKQRERSLIGGSN